MNKQKTGYCDYIIQTAAAQMPGSCKGWYKRIGLLCVDEGIDSVSMISERAKGVRYVVETWERLNVGRSEACAYQRALKEARDKRALLRGRVDVVRTPKGRIRRPSVQPVCDMCGEDCSDGFVMYVTPVGELVCLDC
jgi:hypothetical protein